MFRSILASLMLGMASSQTGIHPNVETWSTEADVEKKRPPSMLVQKANLMYSCDKDKLFAMRHCTDSGMPTELKFACVREVPIKARDCRNNKMCELKLSFMENRCHSFYKEQAYGHEEMSEAKIEAVGKCYTTILKDHMKCKQKVSETTALAMKKML